jgi:hypothetical protein
VRSRTSLSVVVRTFAPCRPFVLSRPLVSRRFATFGLSGLRYLRSSCLRDRRHSCFRDLRPLGPSRPVTGRPFSAEGQSGKSCLVSTSVGTAGSIPVVLGHGSHPSRDGRGAFHDASTCLCGCRINPCRLGSLIWRAPDFRIISWSRKPVTLTTLGMCPELLVASAPPGARNCSSLRPRRVPGIARRFGPAGSPLLLVAFAGAAQLRAQGLVDVGERIDRVCHVAGGVAVELVCL